MECIKSKQETSKTEQLDRLERLERRERLQRLEKNLYVQKYNQMFQYPYGVNPYQTNKEKQKKTDEDLLKQEYQKHQKIIEKLKKDGVNINDYYKNSGLFCKCPICSRQFSEDQKPMKVKLIKSSAGAKIKNKISCYNKLLRGLNYNYFDLNS